MQRRWIVGLVAALAAVGLVVAVRHCRKDSTETHDIEARSSPADASETGTAASSESREVRPTMTPDRETRDVGTIDVDPGTGVPERPPTQPVPVLELDSAESTVRTQTALLRDRRDEEFTDTFLPAIRGQLTARALARCRQRVITSNRGIAPDWETAEETLEDGHRVRRVSIFGHETTGFHEVDGRWLADRLWCVPTDVPDDA